MAKQTTQRDAFWTRVYELAKNDRNIIVVSEDMGAPALDKFRVDLPAQFVNVGIAEQNGLLVGSGMAQEGKRPFIYAIAPFVTLRCLEQIRVASGIMNIPVTIVGVGGGFGYEDSGPTHHLIEDIAIMRSMPNITIHSVSDPVMAAAVAGMSISMKHTNYVRLDRKPGPDLYKPGTDFAAGFNVLRVGRDGLILATGYMVQNAMKVADDLSKSGKKVGIIDVHTIPTGEQALLREIARAKAIFTMEEHFLPGGLGSYILELMNDNGAVAPVKRFGLGHDRGYCYKYGGRDEIHVYYGVDVASVKKAILSLLKK